MRLHSTKYVFLRLSRFLAHELTTFYQYMSELPTHTGHMTNAKFITRLLYRNCNQFSCVYTTIATNTIVTANAF